MWLSSEIVQGEQILKCLVLGDYGRGKSWFASTFPDPICVLDFDDGKLSYMREASKGRRIFIYNEMLDTQTPIQTRWSKLIAFLDEVITSNKEGFKTVVLDSTTTCTEWCMEQATTIKPLPPNTPPIWNVHYPLVKTYMHQILTRLKKFRGNVVCISHVEYDKDDTTGEIQATPSVSGKLKAIIPSYFDEVYFADVRPVAQGKTVRNQYQLLLAPQGFKKARSRLRSLYPAIPDIIPNNFGELLKHMQTK